MQICYMAIPFRSDTDIAEAGNEEAGSSWFDGGVVAASCCCVPTVGCGYSEIRAWDARRDIVGIGGVGTSPPRVGDMKVGNIVPAGGRVGAAGGTAA